MVTYLIKIIRSMDRTDVSMRYVAQVNSIHISVLTPWGQTILIVLPHSHFNFCSLEFSLLSLPFFMGRKWAKTCINCRKLTRSLQPSSKKACTIRSPKGFMASSGMRKKSSRLRVPQSPRSRLVNLLYRRSIWLGVTIDKPNTYLHLGKLITWVRTNAKN
jgi:hypothetical protein